MDFYLVRHAQAKAADEDPKRPLSDRGHSEIEGVARAAAARGVRVSEILHSDKVRAKQTAEILAKFLSPRFGVRQIGGLSPEDDPVIAKAELDAANEPLVLVGHLPHLGRLASLLISGDSERLSINFATASMICFSRAAGRWEMTWSLSPDPA